MTKSSQPTNKSTGLVIRHGDVQINVGDLLNVDVDDLSNEYAQQASVYAWIANLVAEADYALSSAKHARELEYAQAYEYYRGELSASGGKPTEATIGAAITMDDAYSSSRNRELECERTYKMLRALLDALKMRADMLVSLGAHLRAELNMTGAHVNDMVTGHYKKQAR